MQTKKTSEILHIVTHKLTVATHERPFLLAHLLADTVKRSSFCIKMCVF